MANKVFLSLRYKLPYADHTNSPNGLSSFTHITSIPQKGLFFFIFTL